MAAHPPPSLPPPPSSLVPTITPASLSSLAIYNPSLGPTDETVADQIVFYTSRAGSSDDDENEKLLHVGLAQGVVGFARDFSSADDCTWVDTQKARMVIMETEEKGWWILAKIELTYLHNPTTQPAKSEWSSREVSPPQLICSQLRRAYLQYRFRYGMLEDGIKKLGRPAFCKRLHKYWNRWAWSRWEVMLYRNPALDLLGDRAVKMAGARSGVEIGEQERRFLEGWAKKEKARGVVDMVVSRFGKEVDLQLFRDGEDGGQKDASENDSGFWFWGKGGREGKRSDEKNQDQGPKVVMPEDGCVFRGIGEISTKSVIDLTNYLAELYETSDSTTLPGRTASQRRHPRRKTRRSQRASLASQFPTDGSGRKMASSDAEGAPRNSTSTVRARGESTRMAPASVPEPVSTLTPAPTSSLPPSIPNTTPPPDPPPVEETPPLAPMVDVDPQPNDTPLLSEPTTNSTQTLIATSQYASTKVMNILTFGWSGSRTNSPAPSTSSNQAPSTPGYSEPTPPRKLPSTPGRFLIGFQGDLDLEDIDDDFEASDGRITSRTVWITPANAPNEGMNEYRLVVYTYPPLYFAFLLQPNSRHLTSSSFYREIHHQLSPLVQRILNPPSSISVKSISTTSTAATSRTSEPPSNFTFLYTPKSSTLHCTIPPIPDPGSSPTTSGTEPAWSRTDALHINAVVLSMLTDTTKTHKTSPATATATTTTTTREKSVRSNRGCWVHWVAVDGKGGGGEGILIRRPGKPGSSGKGVVTAAATTAGGGGAGGKDNDRKKKTKGGGQQGETVEDEDKDDAGSHLRALVEAEVVAAEEE